MNKGALILGGSLAGLQTALDLADSGIKVHLVEGAPFFRDKSIEAIQDHDLNRRLLEVLNHPNITTWTNTRIAEIEGTRNHFHVELSRQPRYVDLDRCTACGECGVVCPVTVPGTEHKAIYLDGQPGCMVIDKPGKAPCASACPSGVHVQGYVALINQGRYQEAIDLIREVLPFPSVCGRVCNHQCEAACSRGKADGAVNIMALKRFVADWWYENQSKQTVDSNNGKAFDLPQPSGKRVAIIGAGPAGLTAARDLVRAGHSVKVFDALPVAGGMMRVGIPPHRLPSHLLDWEIQQILDEGVELELNTRIVDVPGLLNQGFDAVLIATGAHKAKKLRLPNADHADNWLSLDFLREARLGEEGKTDRQIALNGKRVLVLGGGNVAFDSARVAVRLGANEVRVACLEPRGEMPGFEWEIQAAEEEGIKIFPGRTFKEIVVEKDKIIGVRCVEVNFRGFIDGRPDIDEILEAEHVLPADLVIWAIGQQPDLSFLPDDAGIKTFESNSIHSDVDMMTSAPGVFVAGDVRRGVTFFVVDAIGEGHKTARSIDRYLRGEDGLQEPIGLPVIELSREEILERLQTGAPSPQPRIEISCLPAKDRSLNFNEVDLSFTEEEAREESSRCLSCGPCSECMACVQVCSANAIDHNQLEHSSSLDVGAVVYSGDPAALEVLITNQTPGIYGISPDDVLQGSQVAAYVMSDLNVRQPLYSQTLAEVRPLRPERIGVLICECGGKISDAIDVQAICDQAVNWPGVAYSQTISHACLPESAQVFRKVIETHQLDRVALGSCSCCSLDQVCYSCTYQRVRCKNNLGVYLPHGATDLSMSEIGAFEFVNIREHCAWVHADDPGKAIDKTILLMRAAVSRARSKIVETGKIMPVDRSVLILGEGDAAPVCAQTLRSLKIAAQRFDGELDRSWRDGGQYAVSLNKDTRKASSLIIVPANKQEERSLLSLLNLDSFEPVVENFGSGMDALRPGVFYCDPKIDPLRAGAAAAVQAAAWLNRTARRKTQNIAVVDPARCRACRTCVDICEFGASVLGGVGAERSARIDPIICAGCGVCIAHCPTGAITKGLSPDTQLMESWLGLTGPKNQDQLTIAAFACNWNAYYALEDAGAKHLSYPPEIIPYRVACLGEISPGIIMKAFESGADGVIMLGCAADECHYHFGSGSAEDVYSETRALVNLLGYRDEQFNMLRIAIRDEDDFAQILQRFAEKLNGDQR